jgi:hypothetical protein
MKALSFLQPRAEQIIRGEKSVDIRTWHVRYRGDLAVHASSKRRDARCLQLGFDPHALDYGALIGVVEIVDMELIDEARYEALRGQHRLDTPFPGSPCYAWHCVDPRRFEEPFPHRGRMRIFHVEPGVEPEDVLSRGQSRRRAPYRVTPPPEPDPEHPFLLYTTPEEGNGYRIALYQWLQRNDDRDTGPGDPSGPASGAIWGIELGGDALRAVVDHLLNALRVNDYRATDLAPGSGREEPFYLDELTGIRLALIMLAVKPLRRHDRIESIGHGVQAMGDEEAYYWFSKCTAGQDAGRARKALRVLLSDD